MDESRQRVPFSPFYAPPGRPVRKVQGVALIFYAVALVLHLTDQASLALWFTVVGLVLFLGAAVWAYRHRREFRRKESGNEPGRRR